jgi:hypothetical protein
MERCGSRVCGGSGQEVMVYREFRMICDCLWLAICLLWGGAANNDELFRGSKQVSEQFPGPVSLHGRKHMILRNTDLYSISERFHDSPLLTSGVVKVLDAVHELQNSAPHLVSNLHAFHSPAPLQWNSISLLKCYYIFN